MKKLWMIDAAPNLHSLRVPPSNHLEVLKGTRKGQYSIRINIQWRICLNGNWEMLTKLKSLTTIRRVIYYACQ